MNEWNRPPLTKLKMGEGRYLNEDDAWNFARKNGFHFRRLSLLINYQHFVNNIKFNDVVPALKHLFRLINTGTGDQYTRPRDQQVIGKMYELKVKNFLDIWEQINLAQNFCIFDYVTNAPLEQLFYRRPKRYVRPVLGASVRLRTDTAQEIVRSAYTREPFKGWIWLPKHIDSRLNPQDDEVEDLPF